MMNVVNMHSIYVKKKQNKARSLSLSVRWDVMAIPMRQIHWHPWVMNTWSEQETARLLSMGELVSSIRFCSKLRACGINAYALSFKETGILTDDNYLCANVVSMDSHDFKQMLDAYDVLVVCGFIGMNSIGEITTLGRGGSDYTAVLVAKMLDVSEVEIYTDVDGVYDSDPKINKNAKKYKEITYHHMLALHCRVIHDRCIDFAAQNHIRIFLKGTFSDDVGTIIKR